mmetsp:Transcript_9513/g.29630  ORF Transcript_9513/g.29630 Transcript_9513/m.29630 type:complete len:285 (+) Transcript_9513:1488-2342(+)
MGRRKAEKAAARALKRRESGERNRATVISAAAAPSLRRSREFLSSLMERGLRYRLRGPSSNSALLELFHGLDAFWPPLCETPVVEFLYEHGDIKKLEDHAKQLYFAWRHPIKREWSKARRAARRKCSFCGKVALPSEPALSTCGCMAVRYCDKTCQRAHWDAAHCEKCAVRTYDAESRAEFERLLAYHERRRPTGLEATDPMAAQHAATEASTRALAASKRATAAGKKEREAEERANKESRPEALALALKDKNAAMHQKEAAIRETLEAQRQAEAYQAAADWFA